MGVVGRSMKRTRERGQEKEDKTESKRGEKSRGESHNSS